MIKKPTTILPVARGETSGGLNLNFKVLSAIGIIIIVSGHCYHGGISLAYEWFPTYSFNLSLFVFISGYFYKPKHEEHPLKYICKRALRLLLPAYVWNVIYGLFILAMKGFGYTIGEDVNLYNLFVMPFFDGEAFAYNLGAWFVYPLFCVYVFNILFRKLLKSIGAYSEYFISFAYFTIGIAAIYISTVIKIPQEPFNPLKLIFRTAFFLPCYGLGQLYKTKLEKHDRLNSAAYFAIIFGVQLMLLTFCKDLEFTPSTFTKFMNGPVVPYITSITGIAFWLRISKLITPIVQNNKLLRLISDNTYSIMIHQLLGFMCVKWIFYLGNVSFGFFSDFDAASMKSDIWYYYLPKGLTQYGMLYLAAGIFLPIAVAMLQNKITERFKLLFTALKTKQTVK